MKPESRSQTLLSITRSKAKMYEYGVPEEDHIEIWRDPARLFTLTVGLLGDLAAYVNSEEIDENRFQELKNNLVFSAYFFDSYLRSQLNQELNPYVLLLGSASYYLCDLPGSSLLLAKNLDQREYDLECSELDHLLYWLLRGVFSREPHFSNERYDEEIKDISKHLLEFYKSGAGIDDVSKLTSTLRNKAYEIGTPRELLFSDVICAVVKKRIENSTWFSLPKYTDIPIEKWSDTIKKPYFIRELWPAQHLLGQKDVFKGKSAIIQMPTSAGKTRAIQIIIRSAFLSERSSLAVIVAPYRALCHEIRNSYLNSFRGESVTIDEMTDVLQSDFEIGQADGQKQIIVVTPEKLLYVLRHNPEMAEKIGVLVYDEGHQFDSGLRGITYELLLTSLKSLVPKEIQTILLSAVIQNAGDIGEWLCGGEYELVTGTKLMPTYRSIAFTSWLEARGQLRFVSSDNPENEEFFVPRVIEEQKLNLKARERKERSFPERNDGQSVALYLGLKLCVNGSVAIFCGRKSSVANLCDQIVDDFDRGLSLPKPADVSNKEEVQRLVNLCALNLGNMASITESARLGIFTHDRNTPQGIRLAVEHSMKSRDISYVICTSTLAQGVNLPIRYLIITSVYQGSEPITVRDFHNLLGRSGRVDQHTEGSVIIADPRIYDHRRVYKERWRWQHYKQLLNPENSESCTSSLLSLFEPPVEAIGLIEAYMDSDEHLQNYIDDNLSMHAAQFDAEDVKRQIDYKLSIISSIENYLMAHWDETKPGLENDDIVLLASETLAYFLAEEENRGQLIEIFLMLESNIEKKVAEATRRKIYGRTMYGVRSSIKIEDWVNHHIKELISCDNSNDLMRISWSILSENIQNSTFQKCDKPEILLDIAMGWTNGQAYNELFNIACKADMHIIAKSQLRNIKLEHIIDICDNGLSYDGSLVIGAIVEIIELLYSEESEETVIRFLELQKRLKYGLSTPINFAIYELGFPDRVISTDLASICKNTPLDRKSIIRVLKRNEQKARELIDKYPSYYIERLNNLLQ